jgi:hypothetical protein
VKFDNVVQWVNVSIPPCEACLSVGECMTVNRPPVELAPTLGKETGVQRKSHPAKAQPAGRKPSAQAKPVTEVWSCGQGEDAGSVLSPEMGILEDLRINSQ